jgi:DNA modification methylase
VTPHYVDPWLTIYGGDCREVLATLPAESVHCVVTSPPYWGLRDYGTATWLGGGEGCDHVQRNARGDQGRVSTDDRPGNINPTPVDTKVQYRDTCRKCGATRQDSQLGLEPTPEQYVENMVAVFREVRRVIRADATVWLNLGDSYATGSAGSWGSSDKSTLTTGSRNGAWAPGNTVGRTPKRDLSGLKPKDLVGIPWRVAFALQADGWYLRSDIIWSKPNPMPESVTDRPTKSHEYLFLLAKSERYYFDADAVREPHVSVHPSGNGYARPEQISRGRGQSEGWKPDGQGRNIRSVWTIATTPYKAAHFATFPPKLVEPCIKAGTSERGVCPECGAPWRRVVERTGHVNGREPAHQPGNTPTKQDSTGWAPLTRATDRWQPSCAHDAEPVPAVCLDPFAGSGTVGVVAQRLSRRAVLIDLNPDYIEQQLKRNAALPLGLAG